MFERNASPTLVKSPPMNHPPAPSETAAYTTPTTRSRADGGLLDPTVSGTPPPVAGPTEVKVPPT